MNGTSSATSPDDDLDQVTRQQGGQFIDEGQELIRFGDPMDEIYDAAPDAQLINGGAERINALQVTMDRSGAEYINAQKVFLTNAGAKSITGDSSKLIQSGVLQLKVDKAELHQSSSVMTKASTLSVEQGSVVFAAADEVRLGEGASASLVQSRSVNSDGDVRAFMIFSKDVRAGGNVSSTLSMGSAAALGAVFGVVAVLFSRLLGRSDR